MSVFKTFYKIARKHAGSLALYFGIFLILSLVMAGSAQQEAPATFTATSLNICIQDQDNSTLSAALTEYMGGLHTLVDLPNDKEVLQDQLFYRNINYVLFIPKGFEEQLLSGKMEELVTNVKIPGSYDGYFVDGQINDFLTSLHLYLTGGFSMEEALEHTMSITQADTSVEMLAAEDKESNAPLGIYYFFLYMPYVFIMILICGLAPILIIFRKKDLDARISCSSLPLIKRNLQLAAASLLYSVLIWLLFMITGFCIYGTEMLSQLGRLSILNSFAFLLVTLAITLLISFFPLTQNALNMIGNIVGLSMSFLCGIFVGQWLLPEGLSMVSRFLPAYWYVKAHNMAGGVTGEALNVNTYLSYVGIEMLFAIAIFVVALMVSRYLKTSKAN